MLIGGFHQHYLWIFDLHRDRMRGGQRVEVQRRSDDVQEELVHHLPLGTDVVDAAVLHPARKTC